MSGRWAFLFSALWLCGCAHAPLDEPGDPLEPLNRAVFSFNRKADRYVIKPLAQGYQKITPQIVQGAVGNVFDNLDTPRTIVNDILQFRFAQAASDTGRFLLNSTAGFAGMLDVATDAGMPAHYEDFGLTLGRHGVGEGWYLMLPLLGPSTNRDLLGSLLDTPLQLGSYVPLRTDLAMQAVAAIALRAYLLDSEAPMKNVDPYASVRRAYLQDRLNDLQDTTDNSTASVAQPSTETATP